MRHAAVFVMVAACGYGDGEGLYLGMVSYESRAICEPERCAIATGTSTELGVEHWISDTVEAAVVETIEVDRPDLLEVTASQHGVHIRGLAAGVAQLTVGQPGYKGPLELTRVIEVADAAAIQIVSYQTARHMPEPDGRKRLLAASKHALVLERIDAGGEPLLGDYEGTWTSSAPTAPLVSSGITGVLQIVEAAAPETFVVTTDVAQLPIDVVPVSDVASLRVFVKQRPHLAATDGQTIRMPEAASFAFEVEAFDAAGRFIAGRGAPEDLVVEGTNLYYAAADRGFSPEPRDSTLTVRVGAASMRVKLDYP
ncbi:MAG TPA: hypothetical protein VIV11_42280 [Kofleriaceae bacterium]